MDLAIQPAARLFLRGFAIAAITAGAFAVAPAAAQKSDPPPATTSILTGVFTDAQATRGQAVYRETCGNCHSTSEFTGAPFQRKWAGQPILTFFDHVRMSMPLDNPGGLSREQYAAVLAYILKLNNYPTGSAELPTSEDGLRRIRFELRPSN
jgi:mono/diheme cytochrome c family protein